MPRRSELEAVSDDLARRQRDSDAHSLAQVVGTALGATDCVVTVAGERYQWGSVAERWLIQTVEYDGQVQGTLALVRVSGTGGLACCNPPLLTMRLAVEADQLRRDGDAATRELIDDRWRATVEREQQRRGLESDLHDGAQHHLVALEMALALVEHSGATEQPLDALEAKPDTAQTALVDTAVEILLIALTTKGLAAALTTELAGHSDVMLDTTGFQYRYPSLAESTLHFAISEVVNNAHKHAPGTSIRASAGQGTRTGVRGVRQRPRVHRH